MAEQLERRVLDATCAARPGPPVAGAAVRSAQPARSGDGDPARCSAQRVERGDQLPPQAVREVRVRRGGSRPWFWTRAVVAAGSWTGRHRGERPRRREPGGARGDQADRQRVQPGQTGAHPRVAGHLRTLAARVVRRQYRELQSPSPDGCRVRPARRGDRHPDHGMGRAHSRSPRSTPWSTSRCSGTPSRSAIRHADEDQ